MIPSGVEVFVALAPIDLRWGFDRLAGVVQDEIGRSARSGGLFVFLLFSDEQKLAESKHDVEHDGAERVEVGCWYHARRRFWEGAVTKNTVAREGLARIGRIFELDASWQKKQPREIKQLREMHLRAHVSAFFAWVDQEQADLQRATRAGAHCSRVRAQPSGRLAALLRRWPAGAQQQLGRAGDQARRDRQKAWLFCGSDDHAKSTASWFSLVGSARLHGLDPEEYLRCLIRLVPLWPEHRMLELTPLFWAGTRDRLDPSALAAELGPISIPDEPLDTG